jgi:tetratricopeptide (TPR) repeat protein
VITALLIDPASDVVVATLSEQVSGQEAILAALRRQASRVRVALGEQRDRMAGADPAVEQASTRSLRAFQLYNQSYRLGRERRWPAALEIARQTVEADPDFASGWIWLAWATRNAEFGDSPLLRYGVPPTERDRENRETLRPFVERALALTNGLADWERLWIRASASTLLGDHAAAVPLYEALLKLRPEHFYAANNLVTALRRLNRPDDLDRATQVLADQRPNDFGFNLEAATRLLARPGLSWAVNQQAATPYLDRLNALRAQAEARTPIVGRWMAFMPAYRAWQAGDVRGTLDVIDQLRAAPRQSPGVGVGAVDYYLALGRLAQASALVDSVDRPQEKSMMRLLVADATGDAGELRRVLESAPVPENTGALVHIRAGLPRQAQEIVRQPSRDPLVEGINELARGELALAAGREVAGLERLRVGVSMLHMNGGGSREYYIGCESLATELERLGRRDESIDVLEGCATNRVRSQRPDAFAGFWWMRLNLHLADVYRRAGRAPEARTIEQRLRPLLRLADEGFPLLQQLNSR